MQRTMFAPIAITSMRMRGAVAAQARTSDRLMPRDMETWNPRHCLVCVIDDAGQARQAARALLDAGIGEADVRLADAQEIVALDDVSRARGPLARFITTIRTLGDEGLIAAEYLAAARRGHHVLIAHVPGDARMRRALALVSLHRAHTVHYFGQWIVRGM